MGSGVRATSDPATSSYRGLYLGRAGRYRLPTIYSLRGAVVDGGLRSYGVDIIELFSQAAIYADRIVKGEKPAELPVQLPTKFELVANLKTAKAQGFEIPPSLLSIADDVRITCVMSASDPGTDILGRGVCRVCARLQQC